MSRARELDFDSTYIFSFFVQCAIHPEPPALTNLTLPLHIPHFPLPVPVVLSTSLTLTKKVGSVVDHL